MRRKVLRALGAILLCVLIGVVLPEPFVMPVEGATRSSYDQRSYWYHPWGRSVTHKGVDVFAQRGTRVKSAVPGVVVFRGQLSMGGNVVLVLGPKWRLHYYAHLDSIHTHVGAWLSSGEELGTVGNSGNAKGKPAHLHYAIRSLLPRPWLNTAGPHGWRRMWFVDPTPMLNGATALMNGRKGAPALAFMRIGRNTAGFHRLI